MKIEEQVCSLDLAKRLKELGVKQDSTFEWVDCPGTDLKWLKDSPPSLRQVGDYRMGPLSSNKDDMTTIAENIFAAFTVAELGEMLWPRPELNKPYGITLRGVFKELYLHSEGEDSGYSHTDVEFIAEGTTEADARAKMLIHLIEKGLLKP